MITVAMVRWGDKYGPEYVNILCAAIKRNLDMPIRFIVATDNPDGYLEGIETIKLPDGLTGWWGKLWLFSEEFQQHCTERIWYFDLDTVITGPLEELASYKGEFCILRDFYRKDGYGSGLMAWKRGFGTHIWHDWLKTGKPEVDGGDQAWIERVVPKADRWQDVFPDSVVSYKIHSENWPPKGAKIVCFHGFPRPHECKDGWVPLMWKQDALACPRFSNTVNVSTDYMLENIRHSVTRDLPWFRSSAPHNGTAVIVGGAPSLKENFGNIRERQKRGQTIFAMNNALNALMEKGIKPDHAVMMDARPENAAFYKEGHDVSYLINAVCHKDVFDAVEGKNVTVWHSFIDNESEHLEILNQHMDKPWGIIGTGNTVGLTSIILAYFMGYRKIHLYGMDSSYRDNEHHAYAQGLNDGEATFAVWAGGKQYRCARWMMKQASDFQDIFRQMVVRGCTIMAHGEGLLPDVCRHMNEQWAAQIKGEKDAKHVQNL